MGAGTQEDRATDAASHTAEAAPSGQTAPTLDQRELGTFLCSLRTERDLSVERVAEALLCSPSRIRQIELAAALPSGRDLRDLRALFKLDDARADQLMDLAEKAQKQGWWAEYEDLGIPYLGLEQHASSITSYTMWYFPALMQTGDYARAIITGIAPKMEPRILEQRIEARLRRQHVLRPESHVHYQVLLDEAVLHRPVGGPKVMRDQLDKVLTLEQEARVTVQIVPFDIGAHAALDSNFVLLEFDEPGPVPVVYVEGLAVHHYLEDREDVDRYREAVKYLRHSALSPRDSVQRIIQAQDTYTKE